MSMSIIRGPHLRGEKILPDRDSMVFVIDFNLDGSGGEDIDSAQLRYIG